MSSVISLLFCVCLVLKLVNSDCPHPDPWGYEVDFFPSDTTLDDRYLRGFNFTGLLVRRLFDCFIECISRTKCVCASMNFNYTPNAEGFHRCELNSETRRTVNSTLLENRIGFYYVDVRISDGKVCILFFISRLEYTLVAALMHAKSELIDVKPGAHERYLLTTKFIHATCLTQKPPVCAQL